MARCLQFLPSALGVSEGARRIVTGWRWLGAAVVAGFLLVGCASGPDWNQRIGHYSYDDAVREFGPPTGKETLTDGTLVADWLLTSGRVVSTPGVGMYRRRFWSLGTDVHTTPEVHLVLIFGSDKRLTSARQLYK